MKRDLRERLANKREQHWWGRDRYVTRVRQLFLRYMNAQRKVIAFYKKLEPGVATFVMFALPAATALVPLFVLTLGYLSTLIFVVAAITIVLFVWSVAVDLLHVMLIVAYRGTQSVERIALKRNIYVCPYCHTDLWKTRHKLPAYACDGQGHPAWLERKHYFLWPSTAGVFSHKCACGESLSAIRRNGRGKSRDALVASCPKCQHQRRIGVHDFGRLPHIGLAVLGPGSRNGRPGDPTLFMTNAWAGLTSAGANGAGLRVEYADESSANEFANLLKPGSVDGSTSRRRIQTWVWRLSRKGRQSLLYLYDSDLAGDDDPSKSLFLEQTSGVVFAVSAHSGVRDAASVIGEARLSLQQRLGAVRGKLRIPVAVVVQDCKEGEPPETVLASTEEGDGLIGLAENSFDPIRYFPGGPRHSAEAMQWLLSRSGRFASV